MKQTEIGLLPEDWDVINLEKNFTLKARIGWQGLTTAEYLDNGNYGLVTGTDFKGGYIDWDNCVFVEKMRFDQDRNIQLKNGDVLVTKDGTIGKIAYVDFLPKPTTLNSGVFVVRPKSNSISNRFFYYVLMSFYFDDFLLKITAGSTITHLYQKDFVNFNFVCPPLPEQEAIAEALSDADAWIESLEQLIAKKRLIKQGAMQELLSPKEDWEVKKLGEVATISGGGTPSTFVSKYWNGDIEWFTPTEVGYVKYLYSSKRKISDAGLKNSSATVLPINTILLTSRAGIGDLGILKIEACTNQGFQSIICNDTVDVEFIYYLMSTKKEELLKNASGSTFLEISPNKVKSLEIIIPSFTEQTHIATILSDMDVELEALEGQLGKARKVKQGMMQELLTGRVRLV
ncbi:restriction endonuclease subunit S [Chryseobacterium indoltheticum]|uniref:restriction endonuclease subunit S n=1 Tax=Chryseobacterium indoltheticum TaxID=254 RepID=UPI002431C774|nr:restriction endonuclease subunit S [Chryseobacterium indoltheticum]